MSRRLAGCFLVSLLVAGAAIGVAAPAHSLTCWGWLYAINCLKANMPEFDQAHPDIDVTFRVMAPQEIYLKLPSALSTGVNVPDVAVVEDSHIPQMAFTRGLLDLTERTKGDRKSFNDFKWTNATWHGRVYAMPWDSGPVAVFYRRDLFDRAGLRSDPGSVAKLLDTWDDYYRTARTIKETTGAYMLALPGNGNDGRLFEILLQQQGRGYFDEKGNVALDNAQALRTLKFLGRMYKDGLTQEAAAWTDPWQEGIREGTVATIIGASWMDGFIRNWIAGQTAGQWGVVPLPAWTAGAGTRTSNDGGSSLVIAKRGRDTDAALAFTQFMLARRESQLKIMKRYDCFPSLEETYSDPFFGEPLAFYDDQPIRRIFASLAGQIPAWYYTEDYATANSICSAEIQAYLMGTKDAETALKDAARGIRSKTGRK